VNLLAQEAAVAALDDKAHLRKTIRMVTEGRNYLYREFGKMKIRPIDTVTNFVLADLGQDAKGVYEKLLKKGVIIRPMTAWGLKTFIRVTIGTRKENERFIRTLKGVLK
jgi:histidinol-phosphate aminotransferase